jgi:Ca2+-binding RTX toxin-like protein
LAREPGDVDTTTDDDTVPGATSSASTNWDDDGSTFNTTGYNVVDGTSGNDAALQGGAGNDVVRGFAGNDDLWGNSTGNDVLFGGAGDDTISGSDGNCSIWGGTGNDQIAGHNGNDTLVGGSGNDSFRWYQLTEIQGSLDQVKDFTKGVDTLYFSSAQFTKAGFVTDNSYTGGVSAAHTFIWNDSTHTLWYSDSGASGDSVAEFTNGVTLDTSDITVA